MQELQNYVTLARHVDELEHRRNKMNEIAKELAAALKTAEDYLSSHWPADGWGLLDREENKQRKEIMAEIGIALDKYEESKQQ